MTKPVTRKMAVDCLLARAQDIDGIYCGICFADCLPGEDIQFDHIHADVFGGPHEYENLRPVHAQCHKKKTAQDIKNNAKTKRLAAGGRKRKGPKMKSQGFQKGSRPFPKRIEEKK